MRRPARINGFFGSGIALTWMLLTAHSSVSADAGATFSRTRGDASSGGVTVQLVSHRRSYGYHGYFGRRSHYYGSRHYSYRPRYYGSSHYYGYRPVYGYYHYSYRPRYYGYSYLRPYYGYSSPRYSYWVAPRSYSYYRPYFGYSHRSYDYGGYCCPPVTCCTPCQPAPADVQKPRGVQEPYNERPEPQLEPQLPPTPPKADGPSI